MTNKDKTKAVTDKPWMPLIKEVIASYPSYREAGRYLGVSRNTVYFWVHGDSRPSVRESFKIEEMTGGRTKASDLLQGHPFYTQFDDLLDLLNKIMLNPLSKKLKNNLHRLEVLPPIITQCIEQNRISNQDEIEILCAYTQFPVKFWEGIQAHLEYKNKHGELSKNTGWIDANSKE